MPLVPNYSKTAKKLALIPTEGADLAREYDANNQKITEYKLRNRQIRKTLVNKKLIEGDYYNTTIKLYALRLEDNCWYIGQARDPLRRFKKHGGRKGAHWTKRHRPIEIHEIRDTGLTDEGQAARLEDGMTLEYAQKYGIEYVRGGGYCHLSPNWPAHMREPDLRWIMQETA